MKQRFKIIEFTNRSGSRSFRVVGYNREGKQIRENYADVKKAQCRQVELMGDYLGRKPDDAALRATNLTAHQIRIAETVFKRLESDGELYSAVDFWLKHGRKQSTCESPKLDDSLTQYKTWLDGKDCPLRKVTRRNLRKYVSTFVANSANLRVCDFTPELVETFLLGLDIKPSSREAFRKALSSFFSWCSSRPRYWVASNPCREINFNIEEYKSPSVLSVEQCQDLLRESKAFGMTSYFAIGIFAGLRPSEILRLSWNNVNLKDGEIRIELTKTGRPRVTAICDTLRVWLEANKDEPIVPNWWRIKFPKVRRAAGIDPWPVDVMRHTAISHYFRKTGSYGLTAEQFGNSEQIIKTHYQGRVSSEDTAKFYALRPVA